jgi:hypothetical protein
MIMTRKEIISWMKNRYFCWFTYTGWPQMILASLVFYYSVDAASTTYQDDQYTSLNLAPGIQLWLLAAQRAQEIECWIIRDQIRRGSAVGVATGYWLDGLIDVEVVVRVLVGSRIFASPRRPDRPWGSPNLLYNGYWGFFPGGKAAGAWNWPLLSN